MAARKPAARRVIHAPAALKLPKAHPAPPRDEGAPELWTPDQMHGIAGEVVAALLPWTEADGAALYLPLLAAAGSAIGPGPFSWAVADKHVPRLWVVTVGGTSSGRKGSGWSILRLVMEHAAPEWSATNVKSGLSSGEGLIQAMVDVEGDRVLLAIEREFGKVLTVAARTGNTLSDQMRDLWDGHPIDILNRKATALDKHYFSMIGNVTVAELKAKMSDLDLSNGFGNRIMWVYAQRSKLLPAGTGVDNHVVWDIAPKLQKAITRARSIREIKRTAAAEQRWEELYLTMAVTAPPGLLGDVISRREAQNLRLQITLAALDGSKRITLEHVEAAWAAWQYCEESAMYVFGSSTGDHKADKVLAALHAAQGRELRRTYIHSRVLSNNVTRLEMDAIREALTTSGEVTTTKRKPEGGGRPAEFWVLSK
jgi:hypothetical protein